MENLEKREETAAPVDPLEFAVVVGTSRFATGSYHHRKFQRTVYLFFRVDTI